MRKRPIPFGPVILVLALVAPFLAAQTAPSSAAAPAPAAREDPWPPSQLIAPETLAKELEGKKKPLVVCVGFPILYQSAHIPGAQMAGPARDSEGLAKLKEWARSIAKNKPVVIYCGCCPFRECPNIRPAYEALRQAGLINVRVLNLPSNFLTDWMDKDYPIASEK